jgi:hypothetical protein
MNSKQSFRAIMWKYVSLMFVGALAIAMNPSFGSAQRTRGRIRVTVTDSSGGAVIVAQVKVV